MTADTSPTVIVELYRGPSPYVEGTALEEWDRPLDDATWAWLAEQGYDGTDPDLWVNIVPNGTWTPNNHPIAQREMTVAATNEKKV